MLIKKRPDLLLIILILAAISLMGCRATPATPITQVDGAPWIGGKELATAALTPRPGDPTTLAPLALTPTMLGTILPYPTVIVTLVPTASPTFPADLVPTRAEGPLTVAGCEVPYPYAYAWGAASEVQSKLGCPSGLPTNPSGAAQLFEHGFMFWRSSDRTILVVTDNRQWYLRADTFTDGQLTEDPAIIPPAGYLEPVRGFGKVWREDPAIREALGWALMEEYFSSLNWLEFEGGFVVSNPAADQYYALAWDKAGAKEGDHFGAVTPG